MFLGFSPETVDFLWGIRWNNNREWFMEHKPDYVNYLYEPMKALGKELFQPFIEKPGELLKVSRIYRDTRMHHPLPYKESLWICIRQDVEWWGENPCLYFEITPEGISYGFLLWRPRPATMAAIRQYAAEHTQEVTKLFAAVEKATGASIQAETYKRAKPTDIPELERLYSWKGCITCTVDMPFGEDTFGPALKDRVADFFEKVLPLYDFFNKFKTE